MRCLSGSPTEMLLFIGGRAATVDASTCRGGTQQPLQKAIILDPQGRQGAKTVLVITTSQLEPVPPGTRLFAVSLDTACTVGSEPYFRYRETVQ